MDNPVWSNDLVYLREMIIIMIITITITGVCFYISKRADNRRALRLARATTLEPPTPATRPTARPKTTRPA